MSKWLSAARIEVVPITNWLRIADLQGRLPQLVQQLLSNIPKMDPDKAAELVAYLNGADPTEDAGKYTPWLVNQWLEQSPGVSEGYEYTVWSDDYINDIRILLVDIHDAIKINLLPADLGQLGSIEDVKTKAAKVKEQVSEWRAGVAQKRQTTEGIKDPAAAIEGVERIYIDDIYQIFKITTFPGSYAIHAVYGVNTSWCVGNSEKHCKDYLRGGRPLYLIVKDGSAIANLSHDGENSDRQNSEYNYSINDEVQALVDKAGLKIQVANTSADKKYMSSEDVPAVYEGGRWMRERWQGGGADRGGREGDWQGRGEEARARHTQLIEDLLSNIEEIKRDLDDPGLRGWAIELPPNYQGANGRAFINLQGAVFLHGLMSSFMRPLCCGLAAAGVGDVEVRIVRRQRMRGGRAVMQAILTVMHEEED